MSYYIYNGHGDVIQTVDEAGNILNQYVYDAFGNETFTHEVEENAIRYSGEFYDTSTGLYYLRARYYNPYMGRFISEDSYWREDANPLSLNLYTYCHNDPVNFIDPSGHFISSLLKGVASDAKASISAVKEKVKSSSNKSGSLSKSNKKNAESVSREIDTQSKFEKDTDSPISRIINTAKSISSATMSAVLPGRGVSRVINSAFDSAEEIFTKQIEEYNKPKINTLPENYIGIREYLSNNYNVPDEMIGWSNGKVKIYNTELNISNLYLDNSVGKSYALQSDIDEAYKKFSHTYDSMVYDVQRNLIMLGYNLDKYGADGMLGMDGGETVEALKQFQRDTLNEQANLRKTLHRVEDLEMNGLSEYKELMEMNIGVTGGITSDTIEALRFKVKGMNGNVKDEVENNEKEIIEEIATEGISNSDAFALPIKEGTITQLYSPTSHHGLDIGVVEGTPIYAITDGTLNIRINGNNPDTGYGYYVYLDFEYGGSDENRAIYGHLMNDLPDEIIEALGGDSKKITNEFQMYNGATIRVKKGQIIGYTSNTGEVNPPESGFHLHFTLQLKEADDRSEKAGFSWENSVDPLTRFNFFDFPMYDSVKKAIDSSGYLSKYNKYRLD